MLCMLYLLYYIVIFNVAACVCIYPDVLCMHFCIILRIYVCMFVYMSTYMGWCIFMYIYI